MGRFQVVSNALAVTGDRLVAIISVESAGSVMVRDLANGRIHAVCAVTTLLTQAAELAIRQKTEFISAELIDQAAANGIYKLAPLDSDSETQGF